MLGRRRLNASHCASARSPLFPRRIVSFERLVVRLKDDSVDWLMFRKAVIRDLHDKEATTHGIGTTRIYPIGGPPSTPQSLCSKRPNAADGDIVQAASRE